VTTATQTLPALLEAGKRPTAWRQNEGIEVTPALRKAFPAVFNTRRSVNVSEDYKLYRSDKIIDIMQNEGLLLVEVSQERIGWSKKRHAHTQIHSMRFRDPRFTRKALKAVGDCVPEILIKNSHDGRCLFQAMAAVFRLACLNGLVLPDVSLGAVRRRHYGEANDFAKVQEIIAELPKAVSLISDRIANWEAVLLNERQQAALAKLMMDVKMPSGSRRGRDWMTPDMILEHRRDADAPEASGRRSLWRTFNVLQENLTNSTIDHNQEGQRRLSIRPIRGIVDNIGTNQRLWATADAYLASIPKKQLVTA
jgi:hypothetical protein